MKELVNKSSVKYMFLVLSIYIGAFWAPLQYYVSDIFSYWDEVLSILLIPVLIFISVKNKIIIKKSLIGIISPFIAFICIGLISNILADIVDIKIAIQDLFLNMKFIMVLFLYILLYKDMDMKQIKRRYCRHLHFITMILFILFLIDKVMNLFPVYEVRFGINSEQLFFAHPTFASASYWFLMLMLILFDDGESNVYFVILIILNCFTLRYKAIATTMLFISVVLLVKFKTLNKMKYICISLGILSVGIFAYDQLEFYYFGQYARLMPRGAILVTSIEILKDYFPFGTGFASFGSYLSGVNYSPVYSMYGISSIYGMTVNNFEALSDNYWPMVIGQTGFLGFMAQLFIWRGIWICVRKYKDVDSKVFISGIGVLVFLIISSTSESAMVNPIGIALAIVLGVVLSQECHQKEESYGN